MIFAAVFVAATVSNFTGFNTPRQGQMVTTEDMHGQVVEAGMVQIVPSGPDGGFVAYGSGGTETYVPNPGGQGGTLYGSGGTTMIEPSGPGGGYMVYGPNGHGAQWVPDGTGGGTYYTH